MWQHDRIPSQLRGRRQLLLRDGTATAAADGTRAVDVAGGWRADLNAGPSDGYRFAPPILRAISRSRIARSLSLGAHLCDPLGQAALRAQRNLLKRFNLMLPVQSPWQKYSGSFLTQITSTSL